jgi:U3 small nucleolar RNA-associated protein 14
MSASTNKPSLETVKELVQFMRESGVRSFETMGVKVEFTDDMNLKVAAPLTIENDDEGSRMKEIRELLAEAQKDEAANLSWST